LKKSPPNYSPRFDTNFCGGFPDFKMKTWEIPTYISNVFCFFWFVSFPYLSPNECYLALIPSQKEDTRKIKIKDMAK